MRNIAQPQMVLMFSFISKGRFIKKETEELRGGVDHVNSSAHILIIYWYTVRGI
jgi:hypothetical protein